MRLSSAEGFAWFGRTVVLFLAVAGSAAGQVPVVTSFSPQAVRPGETTTVKVRGSNLAGATQLWLSGGGQAQVVAPATNANEVSFKVTLSPEASVGMSGARVATPRGVSGMRLLVVDDLPTVVQAGGNHTPATAQAVSLPVGIDGHITALKSDYYRFAVAAGQRVSIEVLAQRLGSPIDTVFKIYNKKGHELAYAEDTPGIGADPQMSYTFKEGGEYLLEVHDMQNRGSDQSVYRLRIGDFPCVTAAYPMGVKRGVGSSVAFVGINGLDAVPVAANLTEQDQTNWLWVAAKVPGGHSSGFATVSVGNRDEVLEAEPNDAPKEATRVPLGANLNGRFQRKGDVDRFVFTAKANQHYLFNGVTRSQGSPSDLSLQIVKADGSELAFAEDNGPLEGRLDVTFPADGNYTLVVKELNAFGGPDSSYRIEVKPFENRFTLAVGSDVVNVPEGGAATLQVTANRGPFAGPIALSLADAPAGVTAAPVVIDVGQNSGLLVVQAAKGTPAGALHHVKVIGKSLLNGVESTAIATIGESLKTSLNGLMAPPEVVEMVGLGIEPPPNFTIKAEVSEITIGKNLAATAKVIATRAKDYNEEIALALLPVRTTLPKTLAVNLKPIAKNTNEIVFSVSADDAVGLGDYTLLLSGTAKKGDATSVQPLLMPVRILVREPFSLKAAAVAATLERGQSVKLKVSVVRNPAYKGVVALTVQNLPKGVTAAATSIAADKSEADVVLTAAKDAAVGPVSNLTVLGSGIGEKAKPLTSTTPAVTVTVK